MKSLFLLIILLAFLSFSSSWTHADPVEEVFTYFDSTAVHGCGYIFVRNDSFAVRIDPVDFGVEDSLVITGIWFESAMVGQVPVALCEDDSVGPPGRPELGHSPGEPFFTTTYFFPWDNKWIHVVPVGHIRRVDNRPIWVVVQYEIDGLPFKSAMGDPPPPPYRYLGHWEVPGYWWNDESGCNWSVGLVVLRNEPVGIGSEGGGAGPPRAFALGQNYPNPFNPVTTIPFTLAEASRVTLRIFDVRGRLVDVLVDGSMGPGEHEVVWVGRKGRSGVYFYELRVGKAVARRRMLLVK